MTEQTFHVLEVIEFRQGPVLVARYRPDFGYRMTEVNESFIADLIKAGKAALGAPPAAVRQASGTKVSGKVSTRKPAANKRAKP